MNIYIVRHGQTDSNIIKNRFGGRVDVLLNDVGREEAREVKRNLDGITFDRVYSSPLKRALETAQIISDGNIIIDDRLIERSNGDLEGRIWSEITDKIDFSNEEFIKKYNIEPDDQIINRVDSFFDEISNLEECQNILVVTHAGTGMYARRYFEGEPENGDIKSYKLKNCEILTYSVENKIYKKKC